VGDDRHLTISAGAPAPAAGGSSDAAGISAAASRAGPLRQQAKELWDLCQQEGSGFWQVSQGEILEMLQGAGLTPELQALLDRR
jgi:hypothetical protein